MKIRSITICNRYGVLIPQDIIFANANDRGNQVISLIGPNGSGKTTLCSFIAHAIQSLAVGRKMNIDFWISLYVGSREINIECFDSEYRVYDRQTLIFENDAKRKNTKDTIAKLKAAMKSIFLDGKIILSIFETRGEYPYQKSWNYAGHDPIVWLDISKLYEEHLYNFPPFTKGVLRYLLDRTKKIIANDAFEYLSFKFADIVEVKLTSKLVDHTNERYKELAGEGTESKELDKLVATLKSIEGLTRPPPDGRNDQVGWSHGS